MAHKENEYKPDYVSPPGETLDEIRRERRITQVELAERIGMSRKHVKDIIEGKAPITSETALRLEHVLGVSARFWNRREETYRDFLARAAEKQRLEASDHWLRKFRHFNRMVEFGWVRQCDSRVDRARALLDFFGVASPEIWKRKWANVAVQYRKSRTPDADPYALAAWLRQGEIQAQRIECEPYNERKFRDALREIRGLTTATPVFFQPQLVERCASCGVAVVFVPELPNTASGATRWLSSDKALIQLSLKYKTEDHLWFTFFHEAGHIVLHPKKALFLEGLETGFEKQEKEADAFATRTLIPPEAYRRVIAGGTPTLKQVEHFAQELRISPGIVVGQLQHHGEFPYNRGNKLKHKLKWAMKSA